MGKVRIHLLAALFLCGLFIGCAPGHGRFDPKTGIYSTEQAGDPVVINAQKTRALALETFDLLFQVEFQNRDNLWKTSHEIKAFVDVVRRDGNQWLDDLTAMIRSYQVNRTEDNKVKLDGGLKIVTDALTTAQKYIAQAKNK